MKYAADFRYIAREALRGKWIVSVVTTFVASLIGAQSAMESAGYNESVREFLRSYDRFPSDILGRLAGVQWPEYFA